MSVKSLFGRKFVLTKNSEDIRRLYLDKTLSRDGLPSIINNTADLMFVTHGKKFFGREDTEGTPERVEAVNNTIRTLNFNTNDIDQVADQCVAALKAKRRPQLAKVLLTTILTRFLPNFQANDRFVADWLFLVDRVNVTFRWLDPFRVTRMARAKERLLKYLGTDNPDIFHHICAVSILLVVIWKIPSGYLKKILRSNNNAVCVNDALHAFRNDVFRATTQPSTLGILPKLVPAKSVVVFHLCKPVEYREDRFLACPAQRFVNHLVQRIVEKYYEGSVVTPLIPIPRELAINPTSSDLFKEQDAAM
eukprot:c3597_g1_i1.p1 GENE.c3597_g1_i1~~c3597_g1_i1.p1  ORF type:complete len:306 (+),score=49.76 c3597_g1_i1:31-948(+)